jgi:hypothetical protein
MRTEVVNSGDDSGFEMTPEHVNKLFPGSGQDVTGAIAGTTTKRKSVKNVGFTGESRVVENTALALGIICPPATRGLELGDEIHVSSKSVPACPGSRTRRQTGAGRH